MTLKENMNPNFTGWPNKDRRQANKDEILVAIFPENGILAVLRKNIVTEISTKRNEKLRCAHGLQDLIAFDAHLNCSTGTR